VEYLFDQRQKKGLYSIYIILFCVVINYYKFAKLNIIDGIIGMRNGAINTRLFYGFDFVIFVSNCISSGNYFIYCPLNQQKRDFSSVVKIIYN